MPFDTLWINQLGDYIPLEHYVSVTQNNIDSILNLKKTSITYLAFDTKNTPIAYELIKKINAQEQIFYKSTFDKEKAYYDNIGNYIEGIIFILFFATIIYAIYRNKKRNNNPFNEVEDDWEEIGSGPILGTLQEREQYAEMMEKRKKAFPPHLIYDGKTLNFSNTEIVHVLEKRFSYYNKLSFEKKNIFIQRTQKFLKTKIFSIHDKSGFKEMPILLSATAIQLSFGLEDYMLPHYKNFNIYPKEFLGIEPTIRFLAGNVSGDCINISWKHYLEGYTNKDDGQNVGLHELAHAYYTQYMLYNDNKNSAFALSHNKYAEVSGIILFKEKGLHKNLYTDYGLKNDQEFWAESVEIFFEKPIVMKLEYPELYEAMCLLLNQNFA